MPDLYRRKALYSSALKPFHATGLFIYPLKQQKIKGFLMFSGGIKKDRGMKWVNAIYYKFRNF